jgi:hypothetical protein
MKSFLPLRAVALVIFVLTLTSLTQGRERRLTMNALVLCERNLKAQRRMWPAEFPGLSELTVFGIAGPTEAKTSSFV